MDFLAVIAHDFYEIIDIELMVDSEFPSSTMTLTSLCGNVELII